MELLMVVLIAFFAGLVMGISGFGSSLIAIPLLVYFYPYHEVVIMMMTFNIFLNVLLLFENDGFSFKYLKDIWVIVLFGSIFTFVGIELLTNLDENIVEGFAAFLILFAVFCRLFKCKQKLKGNFLTQAITGVFSGIGNGAASIDGPPLLLYLTATQASKIRFKNTLASYFLVLGIIGVMVLFFNGEYDSRILINTFHVGIFMMLGIITGITISKRISDNAFDKFVIILLIGLAISLLV